MISLLTFLYIYGSVLVGLVLGIHPQDFPRRIHQTERASLGFLGTVSSPGIERITSVIGSYDIDYRVYKEDVALFGFYVKPGFTICQL